MGMLFSPPLNFTAKHLVFLPILRNSVKNLLVVVLDTYSSLFGVSRANLDRPVGSVGRASDC